jgi:hypothetical protein
VETWRTLFKKKATVWRFSGVIYWMGGWGALPALKSALIFVFFGFLFVR